MTITRALKDQPASSADTNVDLFKLDAAKWEKESHQSSGTSAITVYKHVNGSYVNQTRAIITFNAGKKKDGIPVLIGDIKLLVPYLQADDETGLTTKYGQASFTMGFEIPADDNIDDSDVVKWILTALSIWAPTVTSGVVDPAVVGKHMAGVTQFLD